MPETRFLSAHSLHPNPAHAAGELAGVLIEHSHWGPPELILLFVGKKHLAALEDLVEAIRVIGEPNNIVGAATSAAFGKGVTQKNNEAVTLWAAWGVATDVAVIHTTSNESQLFTFDEPDRDYGNVLVLADPFTFDAEGFIKSMSSKMPNLDIHGAYFSASAHKGGNSFVVNESTQRAGAVLVFFGGLVEGSLVSGARPIGQPFTITEYSEGEIIQMGGQSPMQRLDQLLAAAGLLDKDILIGKIAIGKVVESTDSRDSDEFVIRTIEGINRQTGSFRCSDLAVGDVVQFHLYDPLYAEMQLQQKLETTVGALTSALVFANTSYMNNSVVDLSDTLDLSLVAETVEQVSGFYSSGVFSRASGGGPDYANAALVLLL